MTTQDATQFWPGTDIERSTNNGFTRAPGPAIPAKVRTDRQKASDESRRSYALSTKKPPKPRKTAAELTAPARNQISIPGKAESAKTARIKRVSF
jgi:hypothetical protein